jgi:hypothetical protein
MSQNCSFDVPISSTEAVMLGVCIGEYQIKLNAVGDFNPPFIDILKNRLEPHVPSFGDWQAQPLAIQSIPSDIAWEDEKLGFSKSRPKVLFQKEAEKIVAYRFNLPRRSFLNLVISYLQKCLKIGAVDRVVHNAYDGSDTDDPAAIEQTANALMHKNQLTGLFEIGRHFGRLMATIEAFEEYALEVTSPFNAPETVIPGDPSPRRPDESELAFVYRQSDRSAPFVLSEMAPPRSAEIVPFAKQLLQEPLIAIHCHYAKTILEQVKNLHFATNDHGPDPMYSAMELAYSQSRAAMNCCMLALGNVLGVLHDADAEFNDRNADSPMPREFRLAPSDTADTALEQIMRVERELSINPNWDPKDTIHRLAVTIESIARKLWPNHFSAEAYRSVTWLFNDIIKSGESTATEKRFASIGRTLMSSYRNPVSHDFASVKISLNEARFVLSGVRALVDLWQQMEEERQ